jgi:polo-like kinase 1
MTDKARRKENYFPNIIFDSTHNIQYKRNAFLGRGAFGNCYRITDTNNGNEYAGKIVSKEVLNTHKIKEKLVQEISIHKTLNHKHIVGFHGYFEDESYVYMVLELCERRSMSQLLKRRIILTDPEVRYYINHVLSAVQYLHENNIIHRDLKLANLFINNSMEVKIGDFGLSTQIENGERKKTMCGTPNYIAPEILGKKGHGCEVDVWSIGCILFTLLAGKPPFETTSLKETYCRIQHCDYSIPVTMNKCATNMIRRIFVKDPSKRPKVNDLIQDSFFTGGYIPPTLPTSCLVMAPKFNKVEQTLASKRKPLMEVNTSRNPKEYACQEESMRLNAERVPLKESRNFLTALKVQLLRVLNSKPLEKEPIFADQTEDPTAQPLMWISSWVDYSDKYGFAYKLCDSSIGVIFVDCTKLILMSNRANVQYTDKDGSEMYFTVNHFDKNLKKKMNLLNLFQQYLGTLTKTGTSMPAQEAECLTRLPVLCNWMRYNRAVVMLLSNGTLQINFFPDHSKMLLCPIMGAVTVIDKNDSFWTYKLNLIEQYGCNNNLFWRLQYALRKINEMLKQVP